MRRINLLLLTSLISCTAARPGAHPDDSAAVAPSAHRSQPRAAELFAPGVLSDARRQWRITFTPDGRTAYFGASDGFFPATRQASIYVSRRQGDQWTEPELAPFSGEFSDIDPFITPDGSRLYFSSIRPVDGVARGDVDIWYVERTRSGWSSPIRLGAGINSSADELYPSATAAGDLFFGVGPSAPAADSSWDIYTARRRGLGFAPREPVDGVNTRLPFDPSAPTADWEFNPEITADGRTLVFTSLRPGGFGFGDLYVSHRGAAGWSPPRNLGPAVNTEWDEFHPTLGRDGYLYFVRNSFGETHGDFFRIPIADLDSLRPFGVGTSGAAAF